MALKQADFENLLALRTGLRRFLRWSERQAEAAGLTGPQHQLLLAVRGHSDPQGPTVSDVADYLVLRHNSAVGLIDRAAAAGLVERRPDPANKSAVRIALTPAGQQKLGALSKLHVAELAQLAPTLRALWGAIERAGHETAYPAGRRRS